MSSCLVDPSKPLRIAFILVLSSLFSAFTCNAVFSFNSCQGTVPQPQITTLSPGTISVNAMPALLTVDGSGFVAGSEILWNGNPLQTTFMDSGHLQVTITQETLDSFGGLVGNTVLISVVSPESTFIVGCPNGGSSITLVLDIN